MARLGLFIAATCLASALGPQAAQARVDGSLGNAAQRAQIGLAPLLGLPPAAAFGETLEIRGSVTAVGRRARRVAVVAVLRNATQRFPLGRVVRRGLRRGEMRPYRIAAVIPTRLVTAGPHELRVCAQSRSRRSRCRRHALELTGIAPTPTTGATPTATPAASAIPTAAPTESATPTAAATEAPTTTASATATATGTATPTATPTATATPQGTVGAETVGDRLFPHLGNGGYDALRYELQLSYLPVLHTLTGTATMTAVASQSLTRFSMDLQGFVVSAVTVNGATASTTRFDGPAPGEDPTTAAHKLRITPATPIASGDVFTVIVSYSGVPPVIVDPDQSTEGFLQTPDGAFVVGEPQGSMGWFPSNNHPSDKASMKLSMTVPSPLTVVGNGLHVGPYPPEVPGGNRTWVWDETNPMATYLATATLGNFSVREQTVDGLPYYDAADPTAGTVGGGIAQQPTMMSVFEGRFGDYPFAIYGSIVDRAAVTYALETQTKPVYPSGSAASVKTVAHELSHQWYGNSVTPAVWEEIWLNEGFAAFSAELYEESQNPANTTAMFFESIYNGNAQGSSFWTIPPGRPPTAANLFAGAIYNRGGATLCALRIILGDTDFFRIMRRWATDNRDGVVTTRQFIELVKQETTEDEARLEAFFQDWLYDADKPAITPGNFGNQ